MASNALTAEVRKAGSVQVCENWLGYFPIVGPYVGAGEWTWIIVPFWDTDHGFMTNVGSGARVTVRIVK